MSDKTILPARLSVDALNEHIRTISDRVRTGSIVSRKDSNAVYGAVMALMAHIIALHNDGNALRTATRWRNVETEPPTEAGFVLARWGYGLPEVTNWTGAYWRTLDIDVETPTHWMPLPAPPSEDPDV